MKSDNSKDLDHLHKHLQKLPTGPVTDSAVEGMLATAWNLLAGHDANGMQAFKLNGRTEDLLWNPPILAFRIARHGGTVLGSKRAEIQLWTVDVAAGTAHCSKDGVRQLVPNSPSLKVEPLVEKLLRIIVAKEEHSWVTWRGSDKLKINSALVIPSNGLAKTTITGRRTRLRKCLREKMAEIGWVESSANIYLKK